MEEQVTLVVTVVLSVQEEQVETMQSKQLKLIQDVSIQYVQAVLGDVKKHIHAQQEWDVVHM